MSCTFTCEDFTDPCRRDKKVVGAFNFVYQAALSALWVLVFHKGKPAAAPFSLSVLVCVFAESAAVFFDMLLFEDPSGDSQIFISQLFFVLPTIYFGVYQ